MVLWIQNNPVLIIIGLLIYFVLGAGGSFALECIMQGISSSSKKTSLKEYCLNGIF